MQKKVTIEQYERFYFFIEAERNILLNHRIS